MTREEKLSRDISAIRKSLQSIAKDLNYFRKKDEGEPPTCKDCIHYRQKMTATDNYIFHWCDHQDCAIKECRLHHPCTDFEESKDEEKEEPKYTCKDCTEYQWIRIGEPNELAHWCALHCCTISNEGLREPCSDFVKDGGIS